jgi:hypothetical protein
MIPVWCLWFAMWHVAGQFARATTLLRMDLDDLTSESQTVVYSKITGSRTEWSANHSVIFTVYTVEAVEYLKGQLGASFELRELGGERDGLIMKVPSVPVFTVGEEAVLFVWTDEQGRHQATGFEQGTLGVITDPATGRKMVDRAIRLGSARAASPGPADSPASSRLLAPFFSQIRTSVAKASKASPATANTPGGAQ